MLFLMKKISGNNTQWTIYKAQINEIQNFNKLKAKLKSVYTTSQIATYMH